MWFLYQRELCGWVTEGCQTCYVNTSDDAIVNRCLTSGEIPARDKSFTRTQSDWVFSNTCVERFFPDLWKDKNFRDVFQALLFIFFNRQMVTLNCIHEKKKLKIDLVVFYYALLGLRSGRRLTLETSAFKLGGQSTLFTQLKILTLLIWVNWLTKNRKNSDAYVKCFSTINFSNRKARFTGKQNRSLFLSLLCHTIRHMKDVFLNQAFLNRMARFSRKGNPLASSPWSMIVD